MTNSFKLTEKQQEAQRLIAQGARHFMLYGGSRSGKTFLNLRNVALRAIKAPGSRHGVFRFRLNHLRSTAWADTLPKMMRTAFPGVDYHLNKSDMLATIRGIDPRTKKQVDSEIWFCGLDDKERVEKILGFEFATMFFNESSQIPFSSIDMALSRLAQKVELSIDEKAAGFMPTRVFYDCNPPSKAHWSYKMFVQGLNPETNEPLRDHSQYRFFKINPQDNLDNIDANYLETLKDMSSSNRKRFLDGEFAEANPDALFQAEWIDRWRVESGELPRFVRVVIAIDPSGQEDDDQSSRNDEVGIVVVGLGIDGNAYVVEDSSIAAGPSVWGRVAAERYDAHGCGVAVAEKNFGGGMVGSVLKGARAGINFKLVTASKGKHVRAEPFSGLYESGKIRHVGRLHKLEDELTGFSTHGYTGSKSPNRADALVWALSELFPAIVSNGIKKPLITPPPLRTMPVSNGWMG